MVRVDAGKLHGGRVMRVGAVDGGWRGGGCGVRGLDGGVNDGACVCDCNNPCSLLVPIVRGTVARFSSSLSA